MRIPARLPILSFCLILGGPFLSFSGQCRRGAAGRGVKTTPATAGGACELPGTDLPLENRCRFQ